MSTEAKQYAEYISLDLQEFPELVWIAEEGLHCPLPEGWRVQLTGEGHCFVHEESGKTMTDHPMDSHYRRLAAHEVANCRSARLLRKIRTDLPEPTPQPQRDDSKSAAKAIRYSQTRTIRFWVYLFIGVLLTHMIVSTVVLPQLIREATVTLPVAHYETVSRCMSNPSPQTAPMPSISVDPPAPSPVHEDDVKKSTDEEEGWFW